MKTFLLALAVCISPFITSPDNPPAEAIEYWWCNGCGLMYPVSQKCCLNKDCPLFRERR